MHVIEYFNARTLKSVSGDCRAGESSWRGGRRRDTQSGCGKENFEVVDRVKFFNCPAVPINMLGMCLSCVERRDNVELELALSFVVGSTEL